MLQRLFRAVYKYDVAATLSLTIFPDLVDTERLFENKQHNAFQIFLLKMYITFFSNQQISRDGMDMHISLHLMVYRLLLLLLAVAIGQPIPLQAQDAPEYTVYRSGTPIEIDGQLDEPAWTGAPDVGSFVFPWYESGKREQTVAKLLWDDTHLYVAFICEDEYIWAEHTERDSAVYLDDAVEVFTAPNPDRPRAYFNIEMNVLGIFLDNFQSGQPAANRRENWDGKGIRIKTTIKGTLNDDSDRDEYWILEAAIPFKNFAQVARHTPPEKGDVWHLNLNRLGGNRNEQFSQWSPSQTAKPDFHVPEDFGRVIFSDMTSPFGR